MHFSSFFLIYFPSGKFCTLISFRKKKLSFFLVWHDYIFFWKCLCHIIQYYTVLYSLIYFNNFSTFILFAVLKNWFSLILLVYLYFFFFFRAFFLVVFLKFLVLQFFFYFFFLFVFYIFFISQGLFFVHDNKTHSALVKIF